MSIFDYDLVKDNPGAYTFVKEACMIDFDLAEKVFNRLRDNGVCGPMLYILWNDCFDRDTERAINILETDSMMSIMYHLNDAHKVIENRGIPYGEK